MLILVDFAMQYLEAVPLCNISACHVAESVFCVGITKVRFLKEIQTDQDTTFVTHTS